MGQLSHESLEKVVEYAKQLEEEEDGEKPDNQ
jgi:hypothetical protein